MGILLGMEASGGKRKYEKNISYIEVFASYYL